MRNALPNARTLAILAFGVALGSPGAPAQEDAFGQIQGELYDLYESVSPGVVGVQVRGARGLVSRGGGFGAGFVVDDERKLVLTSTDIIPAAVTEVAVRFADHTVATAKVVARNDDLDAILLECPAMPDSARVLPLGRSSEVQVGAFVLTVGSPYQSIQRVGQVAASLGVVSGIYRAEGNAAYDGEVLELDAAVNPGSFGGPAVDLDGKVIGLVGSTYAHARWLGTAIPIDGIAAWLERVREGADTKVEDAPAERGYLGVTIERSPEGVVVRTIVPGSPADGSGLEVGDVLLQAGNKRLKAPLDWEAFLTGKRPGDSVRLSVKRGEKVLRLDVVLGSKFM